MSAPHTTLLLELDPRCRPLSGALSRALADAVGVRADQVRQMRPTAGGVRVEVAAALQHRMRVPVPLRVPLADGQWTRITARLPDSAPFPRARDERWRLRWPTAEAPTAGEIAAAVAQALGIGAEDVRRIQATEHGAVVRIPTHRVASAVRVSHEVLVGAEPAAVPATLSPAEPAVSVSAWLDFTADLAQRLPDSERAALAERLMAEASGWGAPEKKKP